jgi:hypothetical protein
VFDDAVVKMIRTEGRIHDVGAEFAEGGYVHLLQTKLDVRELAAHGDFLSASDCVAPMDLASVGA